MAQAKVKIKKGDKVIVLAGKDKGKQGEVLAVHREKNRAVVSGVNVVKRHTRPTPQGQGGVVEKESALHVSNIALVDPKTGKATRIGYKFLEDGRKVRFAKGSGEVIDV